MKMFRRMAGLILVFSFLLATSAFAATRASEQIRSYSISVTANRGGEIAIEVSVSALGLMKQIRSVYKELHADHETGAADNK